MDPITQRILDQQRAIQNNPNFTGYQPSAPADGIAAFNSTPVNQDIMFQDTLVQDQPPIDVKQMATNVGKKLITDFAVRKLGLDGLKGNIFKSVIGGNAIGFSNPLTAALTVGSLLPDSAKGLAGILRNNRAQKAIERDIIRDMQRQTTTSSPQGGGGDPGPKTTATKSTASTPSRHTSGAGGLHSGY